MNNDENPKPYDLEDRTLAFAKDIRVFIKSLKMTIANVEDVKQLVRASGSVGANYIEANENLGKKDFLMKLKTCRREAKECRYWLALPDIEDRVAKEHNRLRRESDELMKIFGAIVRKCEQSPGFEFGVSLIRYCFGFRDSRFVLSK
ncbi:MAG: four helix bundle protein [Chthoniobacterales bacterium]